MSRSGGQIFIDEPAPFIKEFVEALDGSLRQIEPDAGLSTLQKQWLAFCLLAIDGTQSGADETTPANPINYYGVLKTVCETVAQETAKNRAVARLSRVNGKHWLRPEAPRSQDVRLGYFVKTIVDALQKNEPVSVWEADNINRVQFL